jgi:glyoxylase-like metal-dependent hydrolase (beta-lactamase superfamily II)
MSDDGPDGPPPTYTPLSLYPFIPLSFYYKYKKITAPIPSQGHLWVESELAAGFITIFTKRGETTVKKKLVIVLAIFMGFGCAATAQNSNNLIADARSALGNVDSVMLTGAARNVAFQQCGANGMALLCEGTHDPMRPITNYVRVIDLEAPALRHAGETLNIGPGGSTAVSAGTFFQQVTTEQASLSGPWGSSLEYYMTPWGFLQGAESQRATSNRRTLNGKTYTVLSWSPDVTAPSGASYVINGYLNDENLVEHVETWVGENIMGDMHIFASYTGWRDFGGFLAPTRLVQNRGGWPFFEIDVTAASANMNNVAALVPAPAAGGGGFGGGGGGPVNVTAENLGNDLYRLTTGAGSYDSLIYEFDDHIMMFEAGANHGVLAAYIEETKRMMPGKPIRYIMNTHPHSDHTAGLPVVVAEGATIITHANNVEFFERALNTPRTLLDDALARNPHRVWVEGVETKAVYSDGDHTVELYHIYPAPHSNGLLVAYFPEQGVLFQGDFSLPAPGQRGNDHVLALVPALEKLGVTDFERYINVHASAEPQTKDELWQAAGR